MSRLRTALRRLKSALQYYRARLLKYECDGGNLALKNGGPCETEGCQECCEHEYDFDEGGMCLNCDAEYPY